jgi:non-ribosomal peptide synthetase component E (peptide arylation enzyme)
MDIQPENMTIRELMERSFKLYHNLPAVAFVNEPMLSYHELKEKVEKTARLLCQCGIRKFEKTPTNKVKRFLYIPNDSPRIFS